MSASTVDENRSSGTPHLVTRYKSAKNIYHGDDEVAAAIPEDWTDADLAELIVQRLGGQPFGKAEADTGSEAGLMKEAATEAASIVGRPSCLTSHRTSLSNPVKFKPIPSNHGMFDNPCGTRPSTDSIEFFAVKLVI
jgi:hypothetical protein